MGSLLAMGRVLGVPPLALEIVGRIVGRSSGACVAMRSHMLVTQLVFNISRAHSFLGGQCSSRSVMVLPCTWADIVGKECSSMVSACEAALHYEAILHLD